MKIEIPDILKDEVLYLITEDNLIAIKKPDKNWVVKEGYCNKCGKCCYNTSERHPFPKDPESKRCMYLVAKKTETGFEYVCDLGHWRPVACLLGFHEPQDKPEFCTETFKEI